MNVGIIGGGMMGLATAHYLSMSGMTVTILEKDSEVGGLSKSEEFLPDFRWDRFYHVILPTDDELLSFVDEIGLTLDVQFTETKTGVFADGKLHSMSSTLDFLRFKPLALWDKLRLGAGVLYASKISNSSYLEKTYAKIWLTRVFGRRNYEKLWDPLLRSKLGTANVRASASFIWACIIRLYGARQKGSKRESFGCVRGGYYTILKKLEEKLAGRDVRILLNQRVDRVEPLSSKTIRVHCQDGETHDFDRLIATVPNPQILRFLPNVQKEFESQLQKVNYLSLVCVALVLKKSLSPFYVTNLTDTGFPFTGLIEATHILPHELLNGKALVYLPRYSPPGDPFYQHSDEAILYDFMNSLRRIFPDFSPRDVITARLHREPYVQPIQETGYTKNIPPMNSPLDRFYVVNTSMILNSTLNNNEVIKLARKMATLILSEMS